MGEINLKKIPTDSFEILRVAFIVFIVIGLAPIAIMLGTSIVTLFIDGFATSISTLVDAIVCSLLLFLFIVFPSFIMEGLCETGISFSKHVSRQTKILEEINKKLDNKEMQENSRQTKILKETNKKLDNEETQENSKQTKILEETDKKLDNEETRE